MAIATPYAGLVEPTTVVSMPVLTVTLKILLRPESEKKMLPAVSTATDTGLDR